MKENVESFKDQMNHFITKRKKTSGIIAGIILIVIVSSFFIIPKAQTAIRTSQINSLVERPVKNKKVKYLDYQTKDKEIADKAAMTVIFASPNAKNYEKVMDFLASSKKMSEFTHSIYIYPLVYNVKKSEEKYKINSSELTVVFFENGKENKRYVIDKSLDLETQLVPELNRMPLAQAVELQPDTTTETTTSTTAEVDGVE